MLYQVYCQSPFLLVFPDSCALAFLVFVTLLLLGAIFITWTVGFLHRSPGGTPLRRNDEGIGTDPADIIAKALKKKFSHQVFQDSPGNFLYL